MKIDCHVHIVGNGSGGSGCRLNIRSPYHQILARYMLSILDLPWSLLSGDLDRVYVQTLVRLVQGSSLDRVMILAHDFVHDSDGNSRPELGSFYVPNDYVLQLGRDHPEFIPAVSIHPARLDALDELNRCIEGGARMMKILPNCHNIDCSDKRYEKFWRRMAEARLPLLAHTGGELSVPVIDKALADPAVLTLPLECGVTVIAAHCGTSSLLLDPDYTGRFLEMLKRYPNLYGDSSALNTPFRSKHYSRLIAPEVRDRILHGSDLPIPVSPFWVFARGLISFKSFKKLRKEKNLLEMDYQIKRALGFGDPSFDRLAEILGLAG